MITDNILYPLLSFIPALLNVAVLLYILFFIPKTKTTDIFGFFVMTLIIWQVQDTILRITGSAETAGFVDKLLCIGWQAFAPVAFHFACRYSSIQSINRRLSLICIYLPFVVFYLLYIANSKPALFDYSENWGWVITPRQGTMDGAQRIFISVYVMATVFILFRYAFSVRNNKRKKIQAFIIAAGIFVPALQGITTQIIYPLILQKPEIPVTSTFMTFFSVATIISIRKYNLFKISELVEVETVLQNLKNMVFVVSTEIEIVYMNPYAEKILSGDTETCQLAGIDKIFFSREDYKAFESEVFEASLEGQLVSNYTTAFKTNEGRRMDILLSAELLKNHKHIRGILIVANDITELSKTIKKLEVSNTELERFAYVASHDLQEPLRKLSTFLQMLEAKYKPVLDETANMYITSAVSCSTYMKQLIHDLLQYSHISFTKDGEATNMNEIIQRVSEILQNEISALGAKIEVDELPLIENANKTQMLQLMLNLVSNGLKFHSDKTPHIKISSRDDGYYWHFSVTDNGIGIEPEHRENIFVIFSRLHNRNQYGGTGVGLSLCKKIVEQHGGKIWVDSNPGGGSIFHFIVTKSFYEISPEAKHTTASDMMPV